MTIERIDKRRSAREQAIPDTELTPRVRATLASLTGEVERLRRELQSAHHRIEQAEREANQDHLLPVLNRRAFARALSRQISLVARYGTPASLLYLDLDGFKRINDAYGHAAGDAVLGHFARILRENVRDSDIVGRLGGDEFAVILARANGEHADKKGRALLEALTAAPPGVDGRAIALGFSCGACEIFPGDSVETVLTRADQAMYARKNAAR